MQRPIAPLHSGVSAGGVPSVVKYEAGSSGSGVGSGGGVSVASVALRGEPTGAPVCFNSDVAAVAKRPLKKGEILDGEGGFTVWGRQVPAAASLAEGYLPLGLASDAALTRDIAEGEALRWSDAAVDMGAEAVKVRREMEAMFSGVRPSGSGTIGQSSSHGL